MECGFWILDLRYSIYFINGQSAANPPIENLNSKIRKISSD
ncbi:hypothetical protein D1AOALGA4SA_4831 [Olavius algarvensis Delta 1 endosymbiont]|nr:hypothetical protein D1AOALGA4SA_4831 [Olavius algarvensis Delta 1 endosymbiont]